MKLTIGKDHAQLEQAASPKRIVLAWYAALPDLQIKNTLRITLGFREETEGMIASPLFALLLEPVLTERHVES
jgi:hypothetical protein